MGDLAWATDLRQPPIPEDADKDPRAFLDLDGRCGMATQSIHHTAV